MSEIELTIKGDIEVLRLQPGDTIVVTVDKRLTMEQGGEIVKQIRERFPDHQAIVMSDGAKLTVQRQEPAARKANP